MAKQIKMDAPALEVLNKDVIFEVREDDKLLGSLNISRGTVEWRPLNHQKGFHMTWEAFDALMREKGKQH